MRVVVSREQKQIQLNNYIRQWTGRFKSVCGAELELTVNDFAKIDLFIGYYRCPECGNLESCILESAIHNYLYENGVTKLNEDKDIKETSFIMKFLRRF